jgi:hypothetical protein
LFVPPLNFLVSSSCGTSSLQCADGFTANSDFTSCIPARDCQRNQILNNNSVCEECGLGRVPNSDGTSCVTCAPYQYVQKACEGDGCEWYSIVCQECPVRMYPEPTTRLSCLECNGNDTLIRLQGSNMVCETCPIGSFLNSDGTLCVDSTYVEPEYRSSTGNDPDPILVR